MNTRKKLLYGLGMGLVAGILDAALVFFVEPSASFWLITQVFIAWVTIGWAVIVTETGFSSIKHCLIVTIFLSLPWYISEAIIPGQWNHLLPLIIQGVVNGLIFTVAKKRLAKVTVNA